MIEIVLSLALAIATGLVWGTVVRLVPAADPERATSGALAPRLHNGDGVGRLLRGPLEPYSATRPTLILALVAILIATTILGVFAVMIHANTGVVTLDVEITRWAAAHATPTSLKVFGYLTQAGGIVVITAAALATVAYAVRRPGRWSAVLFIVLVVGGQLLLANVLKIVIGRVRPNLPPFDVFSGHAFPSGHTTAAAAVWPAVALILSRGRSRRAWAILAGLAVSLGVAVACSRIFLGAHWTSDVLGGLVLGWMWFGLCALALGGAVLGASPRTKQAVAVSCEPERPTIGLTDQEVRDQLDQLTGALPIVPCGSSLPPDIRSVSTETS